MCLCPESWSHKSKSASVYNDAFATLINDVCQSPANWKTVFLTVGPDDDVLSIQTALSRTNCSLKSTMKKKKTATRLYACGHIQYVCMHTDVCMQYCENCSGHCCCRVGSFPCDCDIIYIICVMAFIIIVREIRVLNYLVGDLTRSLDRLGIVIVCYVGTLKLFYFEELSGCIHHAYFELICCEISE